MQGEYFTYDATGNWLNYKRDANGDGMFEVNQTRTHNAANEIQTISGGNTLIAHDRNGCMTRIPKPLDNTSSYTLVYDAWNRLISVCDGDAVVVTYMLYDARNHRIKKTIGDETRLYYFNQQWQCVEERVGTTVDATWIYGLRYIDDVVCRVKNTEVLYALQDPNWNVIAVLNSNGSVAERLTYNSFGRVTFRNASFVARATSSYNWCKTFTSQVYDVETGLMLYRNRYYYPGLGRFITCDPIGYEGDCVNFYRYVGNIPNNAQDPLGLDDCPGGSWSYAGQSVTIGFVGAYVRSSLKLECMKPRIKYRRYTCGDSHCTIVIDKAIKIYTQVDVLFITKGIGFNFGISVGHAFGGHIHGYTRIGDLLGCSGG